MVDHAILHIGQHKTGTTALQDALVADRDRLIDHGVLHPNVGHPMVRETLGSNHNALFYNQHTPDHAWVWQSNLEISRELRRQVASVQSDRLLISAEDAFFVGDRDADDELDAIDSLVPFEKRVVCFLRRPDDYLMSWQKQLLKFGAPIRTLNTPERLANILVKCLGDYRMALEPFLDRYADVQVIRYDRGTNTIDRFYSEVLGMESPDFIAANASIPDAFSVVGQQYRNRTDNKLTRNQIASLIAADPKVKVDLLGPENRKVLCEHFDPINHWLHARFGPDVAFGDASEIAAVPDGWMSAEESVQKFRPLFLSIVEPT